MNETLSQLNEFMFTKINEPKYFSLHNTGDLMRERALEKELREKALQEEEKIKMECKNKPNISNNKTIVSQNKAVKESHIIIRAENKLFWVFYIFKYSFEDYSLLENKFKIEQDFKINSIIKMREFKNELKIHKMKRNLIEDELLNEKKITIKSLNCLALIYKLNIIYVKGRTYYLMRYDDGTNANDTNANDTNANDTNANDTNANDTNANDTNANDTNDNEKGSDPDIYACKNIIEDKKGQISILKITPEITKTIIDTYYHIENIEKPINAFTYYKTQDLNELAEKLDIETSTNGKQKLKKDLYTEICAVF